MARARKRAMTAPTAVVIGLDCPTGLQTARILDGHGVPVIGVAGDPEHPCCRSRACSRIVPADRGGTGLVATLVRLGKEIGEGAVLFPCTDLSVLAISQHRDELATWYRFVLPDHDVIETLLDKGRFYAWAEERGFPVPPTHVLRERADVDRAAATLRFPCVLKPTVKTVAWEEHVGVKAFRVGSPDELSALYERCAPWADLLLVQERVDGNDACHFTCNCYFDTNGEPAVTFTTRKLRQWPPEGGQACLSEECRDDLVRDMTVRLFRAAFHRGLGYLEIKREPATGQYRILEANVGRPTGRSATAEAAGVELIYTQYCDAAGWPLPAAREQRYRGVKWVFVRQDLLAATHLWQRGDLTVREWWRSLRGPKTWALFSWSDSAPFWTDMARTVGKAPNFVRRALDRRGAPVSPHTPSSKRALVPSQSAERVP